MATFLRGLLETKAAPKNAVARGMSNSRGGIYGGAIPNTAKWDIEQAVNQAYERVIWVFRCVDAMAQNSSGIQMLVREYNDVDGKRVEDPELDMLFNRRTNIYETAQQFRYRVATQALLSRRGVFIEIVRNRMGRPIALHILPNSQTRPIPDVKTYVSHYEVITQTQGVVELKPEDVIWLRIKPHPTDPYLQMTPLVAAGIAADTDYLARLYNRNFLTNDGRPGMLVAVAGGLSPEDGEELERRFSGGPTNAGMTTVIEADGINVQDMTSSPRDVQWLEAINGSKEDILLAFGVPESVLGNASGRTFDNADAEFEIFWEVTMRPFMDAMASAYDILTVGGREDNLLLAHDYDTVDVLQRRKRRDRAAAMDEVQSGLKTIDEFFRETNQTPFDVPGTRVLWVPPGSVPVGKDDQDTKNAAALMPVGMAPPADPFASAEAGAQQGSTMGATSAMNIQAARAWRLAGRKSHPLARRHVAGKTETKSQPVVEYKQEKHPYDAARTRVESEISGLLSAWSRRQELTIIERIGGVKVRKNTRHWEGEAGTKALDAIYVVNPQQWADDLVESMSDLLTSIGEREALKAARQMEKNGILQRLLDEGHGYPGGRTPLDRIVGGSGLGRRAVLGYPVSQVEDMIRQSALRQSQKVVDKIAEMDADGASINDIKKEIRKMIGSRSSWKRGLSVAAATSVMEGSRNTVYAQGGKYIKRMWRTMHDERVRPSHREAYNQVRTAGNPFKIGNARLMYPGDPSGPIEETANCRCWVMIYPNLTP